MPMPDPAGDRRARARLLALLASNVAGGYTANPETSGEPPKRIARWSVDVANEILNESGYDSEEDR